jgi:hypothetical protein
MSSELAGVDAHDQAVSRRAMEQLLDTVLQGIAPIWILETQYVVAPGPVWRVTLVLPNNHGGWVQRRYRYDIPSGTLYFVGEHPLDPLAIAQIRATARPLRLP